MSDFHGRMMNVQGSETGGVSYNFGHRDARHACAETALEADDRIATLEAENERLRGALLRCRFWFRRHADETGDAMEREEAAAYAEMCEDVAALSKDGDGDA